MVLVKLDSEHISYMETPNGFRLYVEGSTLTKDKQYKGTVVCPPCMPPSKSDSPDSIFTIWEQKEIYLSDMPMPELRAGDTVYFMFTGSRSDKRIPGYEELFLMGHTQIYGYVRDGQFNVYGGWNLLEPVFTEDNISGGLVPNTYWTKKPSGIHAQAFPLTGVGRVVLEGQPVKRLAMRKGDCVVLPRKQQRGLRWSYKVPLFAGYDNLVAVPSFYQDGVLEGVRGYSEIFSK